MTHQRDTIARLNRPTQQTDGTETTDRNAQQTNRNTQQTKRDTQQTKQVQTEQTNTFDRQNRYRLDTLDRHIRQTEQTDTEERKTKKKKKKQKQEKEKQNKKKE